ncbi:hypothetical protein [Amycolatopsis benzoatilytica]|uniref:hypothetical protein n=1 Tax=Amycolatopsis benzoatilytica TaxID=346045 RepID=UPI0003702726|nr:hypothetical protein [Amycolatopsis benzoatilytica]
MWEDTSFTVAIWGDQVSAPEGFVMEPDEAKMLLSKLQGVRGKLAAMRRSAAYLCGMQAPSQDPSTVAAHVAMTGDGSSNLGAYSYGGGHIDLQIAYLDEFIQRIEGALGMTKSGDQQQAGHFNSIKNQEPKA